MSHKMNHRKLTFVMNYTVWKLVLYSKFWYHNQLAWLLVIMVSCFHWKPTWEAFHSFDRAVNKNLCPGNVWLSANISFMSDNKSCLYKLWAWTARLAGKLSEFALAPVAFTCASSSTFRFWHFSQFKISSLRIWLGFA